MLTITFWVAIGIFVGWNLPQPTWAANAQQKVVDFFKAI